MSNNDDILSLAAAVAEEHVDQTALPEEKVETLTQMIQTYLKLSDDLEERELYNKELRKRVEVLKMVDIPAMMKGLRLVSDDNKGTFRMPDGTKIYLRNDVFVSVAASNREQVISYLKASGHEECLKTEFSTTKLKELIKELRLNGVDPDNDLRTVDGSEPLFKQYAITYVVAQNRPLTPGK